MERFDSCIADDARAFQCADFDGTRFSRGFFTMTSRKASRGATTCGALGEDRLLARILPSVRRRVSSVVIGVGDDGAGGRQRMGRKHLLLKTDCVVEGIHFRPSATPHLVGWKAMARALSDIAAMSGFPQCALVPLLLPKGKTLAYIKAI